MSMIRTLPLALALTLVAGAGFSETLGQSMASGRMSRAAAEQYVAGTGYNVDQASGMSVNSLAFQKWGDD